MRVDVFIFFLSLSFTLVSCYSHDPHWYKRPLFPSTLPDTNVEYFYTLSSGLTLSSDISSVNLVKKLIPRILWVAVKDRNDPLPAHFNELIKKNDFMSTVFGNTSLEAMYNLVNPQGKLK